MSTLRLTNATGEVEKEVACLQLVFHGDCVTKMDASDMSESDRIFTIKALTTKERKVWFVSRGGLPSNGTPSGLPADMKVLYSPQEETRMVM